MNYFKNKRLTAYLSKLIINNFNLGGLHYENESRST